MRINIICIGSLKEDFFQKALNEYSKRISRFMKINILELKEEKLKNDSLSEEERVKEVETKNIIESIKKLKCSYNILLDISGKEITSVELAEKINDLKNESQIDIKELNFIIGGSLGVTNELREFVDYRLSFSKMTFPHQLMRIILLEQVYRAFKIINNESYHK